MTRATSLRENLERAGMVTEEGRLASSAGDIPLRVPSDVFLDGHPGEEVLEWYYPPIEKYLEEVRAGRNRSKAQRRFSRIPDASLLMDFVRLGDALADDIRAFAAKWGALWLCQKHGLPYQHMENPIPPKPSGRHIPIPGGICLIRGHSLEKDEEHGLESVEAWRRLAGQAHAVLSIAAQLHQEERGTRDQWETVLGHDLEDRTWSRYRASHETLWGILASVVDSWLRVGSVRPRLSAVPGGAAETGSPFRIRLETGELFGALALQMMQAVGKQGTTALCSGCGGVFIRSGTRRKYCAGCGNRNRAALRDAQRRRRKKIKEAKGLWEKGVPLVKIAEQVNSRPKTVGGWLESRSNRDRRALDRRSLRHGK